ncbi:MAG TPA: hypothetical protein PKE51_08665 [Gemmatimonadaceae bacterium]|nr:hypothetical protein [Gemmatimonadaceae bacterium]
MDCRRFRDDHLAYLDDTLPGDVMAEAQRHLLTCDACAAVDARVRRSLVIARNHLPEVEPSADFRQRLEARLATCRSEPAPLDDLAVLPTLAVETSRWRVRSSWLAVAAGLGVVTTALVQAGGEPPHEPQLAPALALAPAVHVVPVRPVRRAVSEAEAAGTSSLWPASPLLEAEASAAWSRIPEPLPLRSASSAFTLITYTR